MLWTDPSPGLKIGKVFGHERKEVRCSTSLRRFSRLRRRYARREDIQPQTPSFADRETFFAKLKSSWSASNAEQRSTTGPARSKSSPPECRRMTSEHKRFFHSVSQASRRRFLPMSRPQDRCTLHFTGRYEGKCFIRRIHVTSSLFQE